MLIATPSGAETPLPDPSSEVFISDFGPLAASVLEAAAGAAGWAWRLGFGWQHVPDLAQSPRLRLGASGRGRHFPHGKSVFLKFASGFGMKKAVFDR